MQNNPLFAALLTPHRSLGMTGIRYVVAVYAVLAAIPGIYFFVSGAWPIIGLLGLDAAVLYWALSASLHSGRAFEEITLWRDALEVRHVTARGRERHHRFNPFWVRLGVVRDHEDRVTRLTLTNRGQVLEIGTFLTPADKAQFATEFGQALHSARN